MIPPLHIITDDAILADPHFLENAKAVLDAGGGEIAFHIRGPRSTGSTVFERARALKGDSVRAGARLLVNDRVDVALALELDGAHLGQRSLGPDVARRLLGDRRLLGLSVHGLGEASEGMAGGVDYLIVGALFSTPSHPGVDPAGVGLIQEINSLGPPPTMGIGGITPERVAEVMRGGAQGVAVRGGVWEATDPAAAVGSYLREVHRCLQSG